MVYLDVSPLAALVNLVMRDGDGWVISKHRTFLAFLSRRISTSLAPTKPDDPVTRIVALGVVLWPIASFI